MKVDVSLMISLKRSSDHCKAVRTCGLGHNWNATYLGGVHLVDGDDELTHTEGEGEEGVLAGLAVLGDTSLKLTGTTGDDEDGAVSLRGTGDHVLDEVTVTGGVDDLDKMEKIERWAR